MKRKHIIITKLFEFGGSNTHLKTLIKYFGKENIVLILEDKNQLQYLSNIEGADSLVVKINSKLYPYAHLRYQFTTNLKEIYNILRSILAIQILSIKHGFADVTICAVDPEKHLYMLWLPFCKVIYILHTAPNKKYTSFTSYTCNVMLGERKMIITVSNSNKNLISENWDISDRSKSFIFVIHNCLIESEFNNECKFIRKSDGQHIVTFGHVVNYKNPTIWLEVAKLVTSKRKNVHFSWFGNGPLIDYFKKSTEHDDKINFKGVVADPYNYLKKATIYYQPSLFETHGIAVVEAMSNCLPCVVSDVGGLPESIQHQYSGLVVHPTNVSEQVNAILSLLDNAELRKELGLNGYKKYMNSFSFKIFKIKMDAIYI
ncbi:MAG: glycosyltransferase family 4 protein [Pyrinomonadaceae bacterium]|nr:glycosyltransferase family 4 protein [Sphingobacteriaceae bacterium]